MKSKITLLTIAILMLILVWDVTNNYSYSDSSGAPSAVSGAPADNNHTCATSCHTGTAVTAIPGIITSNIPASGYIPGSTYTITATCSQNGISKWGFEISPQNAIGALMGTPVITNATKTKITNTKYVTHTTAGTMGTNNITWTFNWIAPALGTGGVTFYGAFNYSNNNGAKTGDIIHTSTMTVSEFVATVVSDNVEEETGFNIYPNPLTNASQVSIYMKTEGNIHLSLLNTRGQFVKQLYNNINVKGSFIYNMNNVVDLASGIYFVRLDTETGTALKSVVIL